MCHLFSTLQRLGNLSNEDEPATVHLNNKRCVSSILLTFYVDSSKKTENQEEQTSISYTEYEVDALALKAEEGRGDRRNIQGELHASDEP